MMLGRSNKRQEFYVIRIGYIGMDSPRKFDDQGLDASPVTSHSQIGITLDEAKNNGKP